MAKESIDKFLNDSIADHNWLDAEDRVNAPFSDNLNRDKKPELAAQYAAPNLHPDVSVKGQKPIDPNKELKEKGKVAVVINEVKRQMMAGKSLSHIKETILDRLPESVRVAAKDELMKVAAEYPLLGSVYVDASVFKTASGVKGCEAGAELIKNSSKLAVYVKKVADCGGCSLNCGGYCRVYKKALVDQVPYTDETFDHYRNHLVLSNKIDYNQKLASKEDLKSAMLATPQEPYTREASSYVFHDETKIYASSPQSPTASYEDKDKRDLERDLSLKLASGVAPDEFKNYVMEKYSHVYHSYPEVFKKYADYTGSLGNVFIELDVFKNLSEAVDFVRRHPKAQYVVSSNTTPSIKQVDYAAIQRALGRTLVSDVNEIPLSVWKRSLKEGSYKEEELAANPLAVMKRVAFSTPPRDVTADFHGKNDPVLEAPELQFYGYEPKTASETPEEVEASYNKMRTAAAPDLSSIKQTGNKVVAKLSDDLSIDLEQSAEFDESVKKYL